ncbi:MAG: pseudouridine synthase [Treponema sp.]|nr:pseudouridine synthase [Treponema sp.]
MNINDPDHCPYVVDETEDYAVVYKPPRIHCARLRQGGGNTLLDWYAEIYPPVTGLAGRKEGEGGLLHRLDFETQGLVLFAKNRRSLDFFQELQGGGNFIKEYSAVCIESGAPLPSFPPPPFAASSLFSPGPGGAFVESFFRPFGPGRKQVRPVVEEGRKGIAKDKGGFYRTEIARAEKKSSDCGKDLLLLTLRLRRGFRHQIRCHLSWIGCPVLNDPLYGEQAPDGFMALRADGLIFADPQSGEKRNYRIAPQTCQVLETRANSL